MPTGVRVRVPPKVLNAGVMELVYISDLKSEFYGFESRLWYYYMVSFDKRSKSPVCETGHHQFESGTTHYLENNP